MSKHKRERILPKMEKYVACPYDEKILAFYQGQFEAVYILLFPFFRHGNIPKERFYPATFPRKLELIAHCPPVSWAEILQLSGLDSLARLDVALRTSISGLREDLCDRAASAAIDLFESHGILQPTEGTLSPLLENRILRAIQKLGHDWVWISEEFGRERKLHWIEDLYATENIPYAGHVFTHDHQILVTTHWDSHCSLLCSSHETIEKILSIEPFEGFYCDETTEVYWGS